MSRYYKGASLAVAVALLICFALLVKSERDLKNVRQEMQAVTSANEFLRKTLEDMTVAMTAKDKQIDRLETSDCEAHDKARRPAPKAPRANKAVESEAVRPPL